MRLDKRPLPNQGLWVKLEELSIFRSEGRLRGSVMLYNMGLFTSPYEPCRKGTWLG